MATTGFETDYDAGFDLPTMDEPIEQPVRYTVTEEGAHAETPEETASFWGNAFDEDEITATLKADLPPEGTYYGAGLVAEHRMNRFEGQPEVRYYGSVTNAEGRTCKTSFTIEPKKRINERTGKVAWPYTMFKQCLQAYIKANDGQKPSSADEFDAFMQTARLEHRIVHNMKGTGVNTMGIKAAV